jgi:2-polyprenyl-6-methoxyphenol hydroxylase-like FAD-dependent oxidoreductase
MRQLSSFAAPKGGVVLIGDARATVTPALGQVRNGMEIFNISYCKILS